MVCQHYRFNFRGGLANWLVLKNARSALANYTMMYVKKGYKTLIWSRGKRTTGHNRANDGTLPVPRRAKSIQFAKVKKLTVRKIYTVSSRNMVVPKKIWDGAGIAWPSAASATPATQSAATSRAASGDRAHPAPQAPRLPCQAKVDVAKCHACHAKQMSISLCDKTVVWKIARDKVLCVKDCVWQCFCVKECACVWERLCMTKLLCGEERERVCVCVKDSAWQSCCVKDCVWHGGGGGGGGGRERTV